MAQRARWSSSTPVTPLSVAVKPRTHPPAWHHPADQPRREGREVGEGAGRRGSVSLSLRAANRIARAAVERRQGAEARRVAALAVRGAYDRPRWVLDRLTLGDRMEYEAARYAARSR